MRHRALVTLPYTADQDRLRDLGYRAFRTRPPPRRRTVACRQRGCRRPPTLASSSYAVCEIVFFAILATFVVAARANYLRNARNSCFAAAYRKQLIGSSNI